MILQIVATNKVFNRKDETFFLQKLQKFQFDRNNFLKIESS